MTLNLSYFVAAPWKREAMWTAGIVTRVVYNYVTIVKHLRPIVLRQGTVFDVRLNELVEGSQEEIWFELTQAAI